MATLSPTPIPPAELELLRDLIAQAMLRDQHSLRRQFRQLQQRLKKDQPAEQSYLRLLERADASAKLQAERESLRPRIAVPEDLPIALHTEEIQAQLQSHQVLVVAGETGSGKTTQLPKLCWEAGFGRRARIACTQPRRVAATSIARQVAKELETEIGNLVGYRIRFAEKTSPRTLIQFMTDGMLLAETQHDRFLNAYDAIIVDEAHERSLNVDFLLGYLQQLLPKRPDLRVIITSASIDTRRFSEAFGNAPVVEVSGRAHPVEVQWQPLDPRAEEAGERTVADVVVETVREILDTTWDGDILVFLPGEQEIRETTERLSGGGGKREFEILPLFGRLTAVEQNRVFRESSRRKVVVATNIAETSLTIPGIRYVVDSGLQRVSRYSPRQRIQRLPVELIAQSNALQRAGRAGRVAPGVCIRLYAEETFAQLREYAEPEILRSNLAGVILQMLHLKLGDPNASGVDRIRNFPFLDPPAAPAIKEGFRLLRELGAVDDEHRLTLRGRQMARLPIEPTIARMLLEAHEERAMTEVLVIAAGLSIQDPREFPLEKKEQARQQHRAFVNPESDFLTLLNIWNAYHDEWDVLRSENKLRKFCKAHFLSFVR
ncbi:MAG TPA: ATP-dependent RNA helicase HrpA, partial [Deltaproteobacteria bacterium]|nr:ATP-dependent RNA helicase HrpA [Deltaproteobacteria bacterium]